MDIVSSALIQNDLMGHRLWCKGITKIWI